MTSNLAYTSQANPIEFTMLSKKSNKREQSAHENAIFETFLNVIIRHKIQSILMKFFHVDTKSDEPPSIYTLSLSLSPFSFSFPIACEFVVPMF